MVIVNALIMEIQMRFIVIIDIINIVFVVTVIKRRITFPFVSVALFKTLGG